MSHVLSDNAYYCEESKDEFKKAETRPGIHIYNPKTPVALHLPGGIQKFNDIFMEATFPKDMKTVSFEFWWSARMDMPLLELTSEQYKPGQLCHTLDDYDLRRYEIPEKGYSFEPGAPHKIQFHLEMKESKTFPAKVEAADPDESCTDDPEASEAGSNKVVLKAETTQETFDNAASKPLPLISVRINGRYALFELLDRFADATPYDRFYIKGDIDIKVIRVVYEEPLPVPLSLPLASAGILKGDRYQIKGKNPRNAKEFRLVFGEASLDVPLSAEHEEVVLDVTGVEDGRCSAKLNGVELPGAVVKGPFLTERMVLEGDLDFHWVTIVKAGSAAGIQALEQGNKTEAKEQATAAKPKEDTSKKDEAGKA